MENNSFPKKAIFLDKKGYLQTASIDYVPNVFLSIYSFNTSQQETGYINLYFHPNKRIFLDTVYCYDEFRGNNIAKNLNNLADYLLQNYSGYIIRGVYQPSQLSTDRKNSIVRSKEELDLRATRFYHSCGFSIISLEEYQKNPNKYPDLDIMNDFQLGEELATSIVAKKVKTKSNYYFTEIDGMLVSDDILQLNSQQENSEWKNIRL